MKAEGTGSPCFEVVALDETGRGPLSNENYFHENYSHFLPVLTDQSIHFREMVRIIKRSVPIVGMHILRKSNDRVRYQSLDPFVAIDFHLVP